LTEAATAGQHAEPRSPPVPRIQIVTVEQAMAPSGRAVRLPARRLSARRLSPRHRTTPSSRNTAASAPPHDWPPLCQPNPIDEFLVNARR
jgi:hypothetical protein